MKKKLLSMIFGISVIMSTLPTIVYAVWDDTIGPECSIVIEFSALEEQVYYTTLLLKWKTGLSPYTTSDKWTVTDNGKLYIDDEKYGKIPWRIFREYQDDDNFYFDSYVIRLDEDETFIWGFYVPDEFKILVYLPQTGQFAVSDVYKRYAFDSYFSVKLENLDINSLEDTLSVTIEKNYDYTWEIISLIVRIFVTIAVEILLALLFGLRKKNILLFIVITNIMTQTVLNVLLNASNYVAGPVAFIFSYVFIGFLVFVIEVIAYSIYFKKVNKINGDYIIKKWVAPIYVLCASILSFVAGILITIVVPGIF